MMGTFSGIFSGAVFSVLGILIALVYFQNASPLNNISFLGIPAGLILIGGGFIFWGIKQKSASTKAARKLAAEQVGENFLQKNNEMVEDWRKTAKMRDDLKLLQQSAALEDDRKKSF